MPLEIDTRVMKTAHRTQYKARTYTAPLDRERQKIKRRESDAKCRANLSLSFERLKKEVLDDLSKSRVSREMILQETLWKIQYLEGILILLEQTKDKQNGKKSGASTDARLDAIHREFSKTCTTSSIHGNKKMKMISDAIYTHHNLPSMVTPANHTNVRALQKSAGVTANIRTADQVVPKPAAQGAWNSSPPHTIIVPYITSRRSQQNTYPQEVPVCYSPGARQMLPMVPPGYLTDATTDDSPMSTPDSTPSRRYKIKGTSIESVPIDGEMFGEGEPDLRCKEIFPYWLDRELERRERQPRTSTETPLKAPNTSEVNKPYPMAPRKIKNSHWSEKYLKHLDETKKSCTTYRKIQQRPAGKRLFTEIIRGNVLLDDIYQNYGYIDTHGGRPKRTYRKLCTAARVRPYNRVTGKVQSPVKRRNRVIRRRMDEPPEDPEFHLNSYYKRRMKQSGTRNITVTHALPQRQKRTSSPITLYGYNAGDAEQVLDGLLDQEDRRVQHYLKHVQEYKDEEADSQCSLVLHDIPSLPEEIMGPLDIDDEGIVDTILEMESESMSSIEPQDSSSSSNTHSQISSSGSANAHIPDNEMQNAFYNSSQEPQSLWISPDGEILDKEQHSDDIISPSLAAYASLALSSSQNEAAPKNISVPVLYISPIKQTPLIGSNPTLSSAFMMDQEQKVSSSKEAYPDLGFISPLSTSSLIGNLAQPYIIDVESIKDVTEVDYDKDKNIGMGQGDANLWDLDQLDLMAELNSSLDELIDREVMLCSPRIIPKMIGVEVPSRDTFLEGTPQLDKGQGLPSSQNSHFGLVDNQQNSEDSVLEFQVVPDFLSQDEARFGLESESWN